ncbi:hypothetical protein JCM1841_001962 [Sporobolomyces salmonicolor]
MDRMTVKPSPALRDTHAAGGLAAPAQAVRKQRSQRFTVPLSPQRMQSSSPSPSSYSIPPSTLAFQPAPLPVQAQSIGLAPETYYQTSSDGRSGRGGEGGGGGRREYSSSVSSSEEEQPHQQRTQYSHPSPLSYQFQPPPQQPQYHPYRPHPLPSPSPSPSPSPAPAPGSAALSYGGLPGSPPMEFTYHHQGMSFLAAPGAPGGFAPSAPQGFARGFRSTGGGYGARQGQGMSTMQGEDEVIDTAIVIKSIPFSAPKEQLLAVMDSLSLPAPFAFNYHYDTSAASPAQVPQFRGLAFANYRTAEEARLTVSALNGFEFQGRKLRAEFKRVLKPGEKEAIEREKALKRMRSAQLLATSAAAAAEYLGPPVPAAPGGWNRREASAPGGYPIGLPFSGFGTGMVAGEEEDYGRPILGGAFSRTFGGVREYGTVAGGEVEGMRMGRQASLSMSESEGGSESLSGSGASERLSAGGERKNELDLNDPPTLEIYSRVLLFRDDSLRDELAFARSLTAGQRRIVHLVAKKLGMDHRSEGDEREGGRQVIVYKRGKAPGGDERKPHTLRQHASASHLRRPSSRDSFSHSYHQSHSLSPSRARTPPPPSLPTSYSAHYLSPTPLHPSPSALRGKKSMPDIRYSTSGHLVPASSSSSASSALAAPRVTMTPGRRSNANLRGDGVYATIASLPPGRAREVPSVLGLFQQQGISREESEAAAHSRSGSGSGSGGKCEGMPGRREFYASASAGTNEIEGGNGRAEAVRMPEGPGGAAGAGMEWRKR